MDSNAVVSIFFKSVHYQTKPPSDNIYRGSSTIFERVVLEGGGGRRVEGGGWRKEGGGWRIEGGGWREEGGGWRVEGGGWWKEEGGKRRVEGEEWRE